MLAIPAGSGRHRTICWRAAMLLALAGVMALTMMPCPVAGQTTPDRPPSAGAIAANDFLNSLTEAERSWLREHPVIRVAQDPGWPPIEFADARGVPSGMTADYLTLLEARLGLKFERVRNLSWQEAYPRMKRWEIDMTTTVSVTPEREAFWAFTKPYMTMPIVIVTRVDVTYLAGLQELEGRKVAVVDSHAAALWIARDFPDIQLVRVNTTEEALGMLQRGEVFACVENMLVVGHYLADLKITSLKIAGTTPYTNAQCMAVRKDWAPLAGILDQALDSISQAERNAIYRRWLPVRYETGFDYSRLLPVAALVAVFLLGLAAWKRKRADESRGLITNVRPLPPWPACLFAISATAATFGLRLALDGQLGGQPTVVIFTLPIMLSACLGGLRAGLLATAISYFGASYYLLPPINSFEIASSVGRWQQFFVALAGVFISGLCEVLHRARGRAESANRGQQHAESARRTSEEQFSSSFAHSAVGMALVALNGRYLKVNRALCQMLGYAEEELLALTFGDITFPDDLDDKGLVRRLQAGEIVSFQLEKRYRHRQGSLVTVILSVSIVRDEAGRPVHQIAQIQDISDRKRAEEALRESQSRLEEAQRIAHVGSWVWEAATDTSLWSKELCTMLEIDHSGPLPGRTDYARLFTPESVALMDPASAKALQDGTPYSIEMEHVRADGSRMWLQCRGERWFDAQGQIKGLRGTMLDITERKQTEAEIAQLNADLEKRVVERTQELRESEQRLAIAVQAAQAGVWDWDVSSERLRWSPEVFRIFGLDPTTTEISLEAWRGMVHPDDRAGAEERMADAIRKHTRLENEYRVVLPSGELRWVSVLGDTSYADNGQPRVMAGVCLDITVRKHADLELQKLASELRTANQELEALSTAVTRDLRVAEAADRIKSAFLATMSHELRTPLNSIIGFTGIVLLGKAGPLNAEQKKQLEMVRESAWHLLALINDVLDLSKIEAGQIEVRTVPFHLPASIDRVLAMIGPLAEKKGLLLAAEVAPGLDEMVSDQRRVEQILLNLLSNAVKFTEHGRVTLTAEPVPDSRLSPEAEACPAVRLRVTDTGIGIKPEDLALLFQPFHQIDTGLDRHVEGTGLGLAISSRLATLLGGEVTASSLWSQGSEFTVILPLRNPSQS